MQLRLENFRCFREATVTFTPLTVIVGANASGKSTLVRALDPNLVNSLTPSDVWQGHAGRTLKVSMTPAAGKVSNLTWIQGHGPSLDRQAPGSYLMLRLDADRLRASNQAAAATRLALDGGNLVRVFDTLTRTEQAALADRFCQLIPVFRDLDRIAGPQTGHIRLRFQDRWNAERWYEASEVSDGTMFTLAFLLLSKQQPPVDLLAIEDPDHGLHPFLLGEIVSILRRLANGELSGRKMNVVLTTHSPTLLEFVEPSEVRLLNRQEDGSVVISQIPTQDPHWRTAFKVYDESLGQAWLSGGLGGTP